MKFILSFLFFTALGNWTFLTTAAPAKTQPNIVLIYADDLGYGDVGCQGASGLPTPNLDRLAAQSLRFTDAHSAAATCTPSRYAMLTGEYAFRQKGTGILPGDAALIIRPGRPTLPGLLQKTGYRTGVVGKWHLGLGETTIDWNKDIKPGPLEIGFTDSFIMAATGDRVPCVYVQGHRVVALDAKDPMQVSYQTKVGNDPTGEENPELLKMKPKRGHNQTIVNGISRIGYMAGGQTARWKDEDMPDTFLREAVKFMEQNRSQPFFLYYALHEPHVPRVPHPRFIGKSTLGPRGDAIVQLDWSVGEILSALERLQLSENTLVIFSSDNGPVVEDGYQDDAEEKLGAHRPAGPWRGGKYSNFEGGTRVPFFVRWPARVPPGISAALVCQVDLLASLAALVGQAVPTNAAPDSLNVLPALLGESSKGRAHLIEQASQTSLRVGFWKYIPPSMGGKVNPKAGIASDHQLYDLATDPGETKNLAPAQPKRVQEMMAQLEKAKTGSDRRPGSNSLSK